jgi:hypothetical protein
MRSLPTLLFLAFAQRARAALWADLLRKASPFREIFDDIRSDSGIRSDSVSMDRIGAALPATVEAILMAIAISTRLPTNCYVIARPLLLGIRSANGTSLASSRTVGKSRIY